MEGSGQEDADFDPVIGNMLSRCDSIKTSTQPGRFSPVLFFAPSLVKGEILIRLTS